MLPGLHSWWSLNHMLLHWTQFRNCGYFHPSAILFMCSCFCIYLTQYFSMTSSAAEVTRKGVQSASSTTTKYLAHLPCLCRPLTLWCSASRNYISRSHKFMRGPWTHNLPFIFWTDSDRLLLLDINLDGRVSYKLTHAASTYLWEITELQVIGWIWRQSGLMQAWKKDLYDTFRDIYELTAVNKILMVILFCLFQSCLF